MYYTKINTTDNDIDSEGARHLAESLKTNRSLTTLHLYSKYKDGTKYKYFVKTY
mgnify:CR=1 FL=1